ncbi:hypothetical protein [Micromonospora sp. WMMC250]|uniref:hypothetical protein n=1 Tax=Micromonospora sp. WMMC250 TaxID=3014781 RepID=UPI0022B6CBF1|nr:hypothetical protein [Micromonospora sp. WMMC250]MCZ7376598.1 hypothetical protein [Micromonospora sp. WMMC250]
MVAQLTHTNVSNHAVLPASVGRRLRRTDWIAVAVLLAAVPVVHDIKTMLTAPYWLDEAWVALSVRMPLAELPVATSSTPIGWSFLLRLVPDSDYLRVVPLAFHCLSVGVAYALGRLPQWKTRRLGIVAGMVSGAVVLLLPAQQVRHDLKQYSADAAVAVAMLALTAWVEQKWSPRRLWVVVAAVGVGMLLSHVTAIVSPGVFGGLLVAAMIRRQWARLPQVIVAGFAAASLAGAIYAVFSARARSDEMRDFWTAYFPQPHELAGYLAERAHDLTPLLGVPVLVVAGLVVAGAATLMKSGRPATAVAVILLPVTVLVLGVADVYPLLDARTSHFLLVAAAAVAGVGLVGTANLVAGLVSRMLHRTRPTVVTAMVCAVLLVTFTIHNAAWYRFDGDEPGLERSPITMMDVRSATEFVNENRSRNDVVILNDAAWYGFAFYSKRDAIKLVEPYGNTVGWWVEMPSRSDVVITPGTDAEGIRLGVDQALKLAAQRGGARIWLIRSFISLEEAEAWRSVLADFRVEQATGGIEPVVVISER